RASPREAQVRALALWPDLETRPLGDWVLRRSTASNARRANSVLAMGPSGVADDYDRVVEFYAGPPAQRPIAAVLPDSAEDELFRSHGWAPESNDADTTFQIAGVARALRSLRASPTPVDLVETPPVVELVETPPVVEQGGAPAPTGVETPPGSRQPRSPEPQHATARIGDLASGVAAYDRGWVGFRGIEVSPEHRRQGLGLEIMAALLEWGAERGATTAYLQVLGDNEPALALYERLGFTTHHSYRYLARRESR
ncbi:MAG: GCN5-related N-acetyltransferase, partial [Nocardioides sp.]|nr:GCN5-related N-acetyltransferase [Nocardioides sp.]